jgi:TolB protein
MQILLICIFSSAISTNCSKNEPVKPSDEELPPNEGPVHKIVFSAKDSQGQYKLYTINDDGSELKEIFANKAHIGDLWVCPQGDRVVCAVDTSISSSSDYELFLVKIDGSSATMISTTGNGFIEEPQWFPNGQELLFGKSKPYGVQFYRIRADGTNLTRITTNDAISHRFPRLSPDGKKIAFEKRTFPKNTVWVMNSDGTNEKLLSDPTSINEDWQPEWTQNGTKIVYETHKNPGIWVIGIDGSNRQRLSNGLGPHHVSSTNEKIVFGNLDGIYTINIDGSELVKLCSEPANDYPVLWSRDGTKIAFRCDVNRDNKIGVCTIKANGASLREITDSNFEVMSSPYRAFDWIP